MILLVLAALLPSFCFAHAPSSVPSTKTVSKNTAELLLERSSEGSDCAFESLLNKIEKSTDASSLTWSDRRGTPLLLSLAATNSAGMVDRFLLKHSDQVNAQDKAYVGDGRTALHQAAANGNARILTALLAHGAQVNATNTNGETPLHFAARFGQLNALKLLVSHGANLNLQSKHAKATPLLIAAENGQEAIIRELLYFGAKKEIRDVFGKTAPERFKEYVALYHRNHPAKRN